MIDAVTLSSLVKGLASSASSSTEGSSATKGASTVAGLGQSSFVDVMKDTASSMINDLKGAEAMSFQGIAGKANTREVVDAVMAADRSLQTAIAIRDKVVSAYLDITKMPI
jgi:flagellar hook-basal body complex protein FliE